MHHATPRLRTTAAMAAIAGAALLLSAAPAAGQAPEPYVDPPWAGECTVHEFGEGEAPEPGSLEDDPLCVRYAKEDITVDDGGALAFLAGEPGRVAAALPACAYWQQDRWSVQLSDGTPALVSWSGSYWYDRGTGRAGAILRDFQVAGQPAGLHQVADLIEPLSAEQAEALREYSGGPGGGAGGYVTMIGADPSCASSAEEPPADEGDDGGPTAPGPGEGQAPGTAPAAPALPATGGGTVPGVAVAALVVGLAVWRFPGRGPDAP